MNINQGDKRFGGGYVEISAENQKFLKALDQNKTQLDRHIRNLEQKATQVGRTMTKMGGLITGALAGTVYQAARVGDQFDKMSLRTGVATEELSKLSYAAKISGSDTMALETSLRFLARRMDEARQGVGLAKEQFDKMGISVTNATGQMRAAPDMIREIADKMNLLESESEKVAAAMDIFGARSGPGLLPLLKQGSAGIEELTRHAEDLGLVISQESAAAAAQFTDRMTDLRESFSMLVVEIGNNVIPIVQKYIERLTSGISKIIAWTKEHKEATKVMAGFGAATGGLLLGGGALAMLGPVVTRGARAVVKLGTALKSIPALGPIGVGLAGVAAGITAVATAEALYDQARSRGKKDAGAEFERNQKNIEGYKKRLAELQTELKGLEDNIAQFGTSPHMERRMSETLRKIETTTREMARAMGDVFGIMGQTGGGAQAEGTGAIFVAMREGMAEVGKFFDQELTRMEGSLGRFHDTARAAFDFLPQYVAPSRAEAALPNVPHEDRDYILGVEKTVEISGGIWEKAFKDTRDKFKAIWIDSFMWYTAEQKRWAKRALELEARDEGAMRRRRQEQKAGDDLKAYQEALKQRTLRQLSGKAAALAEGFPAPWKVEPETVKTAAQEQANIYNGVMEDLKYSFDDLFASMIDPKRKPAWEQFWEDLKNIAVRKLATITTDIVFSKLLSGSSPLAGSSISVPKAQSVSEIMGSATSNIANFGSTKVAGGDGGSVGGNLADVAAYTQALDWAWNIVQSAAEGRRISKSWEQMAAKFPSETATEKYQIQQALNRVYEQKNGAWINQADVQRAYNELFSPSAGGSAGRNPNTGVNLQTVNINQYFPEADLDNLDPGKLARSMAAALQEAKRSGYVRNDL